MSDRHRSWDSVYVLIEAGTPIRFAIQGNPRLEVMAEAGGAALSLLIPAAFVNSLPIIAIEAIQIQELSLEGEAYVRIVTRLRPLYREFYILVTEIADSMQIDGQPFEQAVNEQLENWKDLLRSICVLSADRQLGLFGELWVLARLISTKGSQMVASWTGPTHEPHDFRYGNVELEVKSTRSRQRAHVINGLEQLQASEGLKLFLVSLQFELGNAEDAVTLPHMVSLVRAALESMPPLLNSFNDRLTQGCGYSAKDEQHYVSRYRLRSKPMLIAVDNQCPRLTKNQIVGIIGNDAQRISDVHYTLNVDGLGTSDGTTEFISILPSE